MANEIRLEQDTIEVVEMHPTGGDPSVRLEQDTVEAIPRFPSVAILEQDTIEVICWIGAGRAWSQVI